MFDQIRIFEVESGVELNGICTDTSRAIVSILLCLEDAAPLYF